MVGLETFAPSGGKTASNNTKRVQLPPPPKLDQSKGNRLYRCLRGKAEFWEGFGLLLLLLILLIRGAYHRGTKETLPASALEDLRDDDMGFAYADRHPAPSLIRDAALTPEPEDILKEVSPFPARPPTPHRRF